MIEQTSRLYPVTLELLCVRHGVVEKFTVDSLAAQIQWVDWFDRRHRGAGCTAPCRVEVVE